MQTPKFSYKKAGAGAGVVGNAEGRRRAQSGLKLRIKIAYKNCIFDQIRHYAYLHILDHCGNDQNLNIQKV